MLLNGRRRGVYHPWLWRRFYIAWFIIVIAPWSEGRAVRRTRIGWVILIGHAKTPQRRSGGLGIVRRWCRPMKQLRSHRSSEVVEGRRWSTAAVCP